MNKFVALCAVAVAFSSSLAFAESSAALKQAIKDIHHYNATDLDKLLSSGAVDANAVTEKGNPLLFEALNHSYWNDDADDILPVVQVLLKHKANPNAIVYDHDWPKSPLVHAIHMRRPKTVQALIAAGADVNYAVCYQTKEGGFLGIGQKNTMAYGKILDAAYQQLAMEYSLVGYDGERINWEQAAQYHGPDDPVSLSDVSRAKFIIKALKDAGAKGWDTTTEKCEAPSKSQDLRASVSDQQSKGAVATGAVAQTAQAKAADAR